MEMLLFVAALTCCGQGSSTEPVSAEVVADVRAQLQTGSLIFSQGDCLAVKVFSQSRYTHVGGVVVNGNDVTVYDSMNGVGVRKSTLEEYLRLQTPCDIRVVNPARRFSADQASAYQAHLESQLGRKYSIKHHLTGQRAEGVHCSEYQTEALMAAQVIQASQPSRVSPGSLLQGLEQAHLCTAGGEYCLKAVAAAAPEGSTWCQRAWHSTVNCCSSCGTQVRRWILCH